MDQAVLGSLPADSVLLTLTRRGRRWSGADGSAPDSYED